MRVGILGDPYYRYNDFESYFFLVFLFYRYEWVGRDTWTYSREFEVSQDIAKHAFWLNCEGIDTVAEILYITI